MKYTLPTDSQKRKEVPLVGGCLRYFPAALAGVAQHSKAGNDKHNPGEEMHHARGKSGDHEECITRHLIDLQDLHADMVRNENGPVPRALFDEVNALCWRALALSQELHERYGGAPLAPGARLPEAEKGADSVVYNRKPLPGYAICGHRHYLTGGLCVMPPKHCGEHTDGHWVWAA